MTGERLPAWRIRRRPRNPLGRCPPAALRAAFRQLADLEQPLLRNEVLPIRSFACEATLPRREASTVHFGAGWLMLEPPLPARPDLKGDHSRLSIELIAQPAAAE